MINNRKHPVNENIFLEILTRDLNLSSKPYVAAAVSVFLSILLTELNKLKKKIIFRRHVPII